MYLYVLTDYVFYVFTILIPLVLYNCTTLVLQY